MEIQILEMNIEARNRIMEWSTLISNSGGDGDVWSGQATGS